MNTAWAWRTPSILGARPRAHLYPAHLPLNAPQLPRCLASRKWRTREVSDSDRKCARCLRMLTRENQELPNASP